MKQKSKRSCKKKYLTRNLSLWNKGTKTNNFPGKFPEGSIAFILIWYRKSGSPRETQNLKWKFWIWYGNSKYKRGICDLIWKFRIWNGISGSEVEFQDLIWKFWLWYGNSRSAMEILDYMRKFWILYGYSRSEMEDPDLKWKFQIWNGNSRSEMEIPDLRWKFQIRWKLSFWYGNSGYYKNHFKKLYIISFFIECSQPKSFEPRKFRSWVQKMEINLPDLPDFFFWGGGRRTVMKQNSKNIYIWLKIYCYGTKEHKQTIFHRKFPEGSIAFLLTW